VKAIDIELESLEKRLASLDKQVRRQNIRAPFAGVVLRADPKEELDRNRILGRQYKPGDVLCTVAKLDKVMMRAYVAETDQSKIKKDAKALAKVGAFPDKVFEAGVEEVGKAGDRFIREAEVLHLMPAVQTQQGNVSAIVHYEAVLKFKGDEDIDKLKPGLTGEAKIYVGKRTLAQRVGSWAWTKIRTMFRV